MEKTIERLKEMAATDSVYWTSEEHTEYRRLAAETGVSIGIDGNLYVRDLITLGGA